MKQRKPLAIHPGVWTVLGVSLGLLLWQLGADTQHIDVFFFASPRRILEKMAALLSDGTLQKHCLTTLKEAAMGLLFGGSLGTLSGLALGVHPKASQGLMPLMVGLNGLPKMALGPIFIIWFGIGLASKVMLSTIIVYFIFLFNLQAGAESTDKALIDAVQLLGGTRRQVLRCVVWPSCVPWLLASLRTCVGLSFTGAIVGEYLGASQGLGWLISNAGVRYDIDEVLCCVLTILLLVVALEGLVRLLEHRLLRWKKHSVSTL